VSEAAHLRACPIGWGLPAPRWLLQNACSKASLPRATQDLDLFVAPTRANLEALKRALSALFDDPAVDEIDPDDLLGDYPAVEYVPPHGRFWIDIITRLGSAFSWEDVDAQAEELSLHGVVVRVATAQLLYAMKKDTVRLQARADAARLRAAFDLEDQGAR